MSRTVLKTTEVTAVDGTVWAVSTVSADPETPGTTTRAVLQVGGTTQAKFVLDDLNAALAE